MLTRNDARMIAEELYKLQKKDEERNAPTEYLTAEEAAAFCKLATRTLYRHKEIPRVKRGKALYYQRKHLNDFMTGKL